MCLWLLAVTASVVPALSEETAENVAALSAEEPIVRSAVSAALRKDRQSLANLHTELVRKRGHAPKAELHIADAVRYLFIMSAPSREEFLQYGEEAVREYRNEELRLRLVQALLDDDYYELAQLKGQNRFNRFTRVFNRASSTLSKLALFQPQDAVLLLFDAAFSMRKARSTSEQERRMIFLAKRFLAEHPQALERAEVEELLRQLSEKFRRDRYEQEILAGQAALDAGDFRNAIYHFESAVRLETTSTEAQQLLARAKEASQAAEQLRYDWVGVTEWETKLTVAEEAQLGEAVRALMAGEERKLASLADQSPTLRDSVAYARAALAEARGLHDNAIVLLEDLRTQLPDTPGGRASAALLETPSYNLDSAFDRAVAALAQERKKFIVTGKRTTDETAYAAGSAMIQSPTYVPALFVTDMLVRGVAEHFRTQLAIDGVVDAGAAYIRRYPGSARATQIAEQLSQLALRGGDPARSRVYLSLAGDERPDRLAKTRENEARQLYARAAESRDLLSRKKLLQQIVTDYPETKIARTAERELAKLQPTLEAGAIVLTPKMLARDKDLAAALGIMPELVDGNKRNGELAAEGIALTADASRYSFRTADGADFLTRTVAADKRVWVRARAIALQSTFAFQATGKEVVQKRILPIQIEGGAGSGGVEVAPKLLPYPEPQDEAELYR